MDIFWKLPNEPIQRDILNAVPDAILVFDQKERLVFANDAARMGFEQMGMPVGESLQAINETIRVFDAGARLLPENLLPVARALRGETVECTEYLIRPLRLDGSFWVECGARPMRGPGGEVTGAVFFLRDVTARKSNDQQNQRLQQLVELIYENNLAGIAQSSVDGRILDFNDAVVKMLGYSAEELRGMRAENLYFNEGERARLLGQLMADSGRANEFEICLRRKDGSRCWAIANTGLMDGRIVSTMVDITDRKLSEETLRQSEQRFSAFMRHMPGLAFIKDLEGKYVYYNDACWSLFGKRPVELVGRTDEEIWPHEAAKTYHENDRIVMQLGRPREFVETVTHPDGEHSWLIYKFPILEDGAVALVGSIGIDITERETLEAQLTQARKMEALGRLAGGVAHDFNNLLTVIAGYGQLALESAGVASPERITSYLQEILNSSKRAAGLTGQLLAFSRRQEVQPRVLDLRELVRNLENLLRRMIGEHVELRPRYPEEPCLILADAHQIEQVLMNLAANARDAMPLGGTLDIVLEGVGAKVALEVRDNGIGMDEAVRARLFEPFFTSKDSGKGTGLGLSTVYGAVSQAGGEIEVESAVGEGTRFRILLPRATGEVDVTEGSSATTPTGLETVLLVEDEASLRELVETILKRLGYRVLVAESGDAALKIWEKEQGRIDVLLTDVIMPRMSGGELAHRVLGLKPELRILFMSGYTDDILASHGVLEGEKQLILKPFSAEELGRRLRGVLDA